ncbi:hypothetical protein SYK_02500 [Pseudodesulfovibrio nedwellii]|uniref:Uncharacterized protein n=1 Tax=Pseudodesulfovibrio nedwellii TaxID=2973072 RepID=A0ABN6S2H1_9BACT|nr:hypothetical protein [Pseudodesulfovibrio nedwellii]BDQ35890.1 hypothetical protein SYK_02500 [Pseudodesulfovibrio nedwellii]
MIKAIPFNVAMTCAILNGEKTQTRRVIKWPAEYYPVEYLGEYPMDEDGIDRHWWVMNLSAETGFIPPHLPGDILWVREPGRVVAYEESADCQYEWMRIKYMADGHDVEINTPWRMSDVWDGNGQKYPYGAPDWVWKKQGIPNGIFKEAARLFVKIVNVRVERVACISKADALAEGMDTQDEDRLLPTPVEQFQYLWNDLAKKGFEWSDNPWVWVYEFERTDKPADWPTN